MTNRIAADPTSETPLGRFLRDRRSKLDPAVLGFPLERRRTPGLRREEVAQRAHISPTWYRFLEQGRGGAPSPEVLERLARALLLNEVEREHLFLLGLGRPPEVRYCKDQGVTPRLQHLIDALYSSPALILTSVANVAAWNRAAASVMYDFGILAPEQRNLLRIVFLDPRARAMQDNWQDVGRYLIGLFRANIARAGTAGEAAPLVEELRQASAEFREMWDDNDVCSFPGETLKHIRHPLLGLLAFEYSTFAIDGRVDLSMMIYHPATSADAQRITSLMQT